MVEQANYLIASSSWPGLLQGAAIKSIKIWFSYTFDNLSYGDGDLGLDI
jgi:hypothetical protein